MGKRINVDFIKDFFNVWDCVRSNHVAIFALQLTVGQRQDHDVSVLFLARAFKQCNLPKIWNTLANFCNFTISPWEHVCSVTMKLQANVLSNQYCLGRGVPQLTSIGAVAFARKEPRFVCLFPGASLTHWNLVILQSTNSTFNVFVRLTRFSMASLETYLRTWNRIDTKKFVRYCKVRRG